MQPLDQEWTRDHDPGYAEDAQDDRLYQQAKAEQADDRGAQRADRDEDGEERDRQDLGNCEGNGDDHPEPERRHPRPFYVDCAGCGG